MKCRPPAFALVLYGHLALLGLLAAAPPDACALDPHRNLSQYAIRTWSGREGLPQNSVTSLLQSRDGYLWLGTQEGLVQFDGIRFTVFNRKNTQQLRRNWVASLFEARDGSLWAGTAGGGLLRYRAGHFTSYTEMQGLSRDWISGVCEDSRGNLWVGTFNGVDVIPAGGLEEPGRWLHYPGVRAVALLADPDGAMWIGTMGRGLWRIQDGKIDSLGLSRDLKDSTITALYRDRKGALWVGTAGTGAFVLEGGRVRRQYGRPDGLPGLMVGGFLEDHDGNLWLATDMGLCRLRDGRIAALTTASTLHSANILSMCEDREGSLWVGTQGGGLTRVMDGKFVPLTTSDGLGRDEIGPICETPDGSVWIGTWGGGLARLRDGKITSYTKKEGLPGEVINALADDRRGGIWIGLMGTGLSHFDGRRFRNWGVKDGLSQQGVFALCVRRNGDVWVGTNGGGVDVMRQGRFVAHYGSRDSVGNGRVRCIHEDRRGTMWVGTMGGGLASFDGDRFRHFRPADGLAADAVGSVLEDADGTLWFGTFGGGLSRFKDGRFVTLGTGCGLFDDMVYGIAEDTAGRFWMSCNNGVFSVPRKDLDAFADGRRGSVTCTAYDEADGMRVHECNSGSPAVTRTRDGRIWFATLGGVAVLDPDHTPLNGTRPSVLIERVRADRKDVPRSQTTVIAPGRGELEVHYAGLSFLSPEKVRFRYRLEGFDRTWVEAGNRRVAYYTNLPPGRYRFHVTACNNDGLWNERGADLDLQLRPHYHQTWWFRALAALVALALALALYRRRVRGLKLQLEERTRSKVALEAANAKLAQALEDLQRAQSSLIEQERLRALGQMASGISHDFNNSLAPILGFTEILLRKPALLDDREKTLDYLDTIHTAAKDAGTIVSRLREFYRPREHGEVFPSISLNDVVEQGLGLTQPKWKGEALARGATIEIVKDLGPLPQIPGSDSDLRELLTNLIFNAVDSMPEGGRLTLRTRLEGERVLLEVRDTGHGMSDEVRRRCLEPFFTTKGERGTGLGLPMVYGIVQRHGGTVDIESRPGEGTRFLVRLPLQGIEPAAEVEAWTDKPVPPLHILLVDDEPNVLRFVTGYLEEDHHTVDTASDGAEGLRKFHAGEFDLVVMDRAMPRMSGDQLAAAVKLFRPGTPVILLTGFGELMSARGEKPEHVDLVLSKPVSIAMLRRAVAKLKAA
ncbi:MAG: response regulator [Candidatus Eisenbacteria bacterium]|nr:response regulator [Candidatus Eisenbacteria bacterium]